MQVFSKSTVVDTNTLGLFDEGVEEVSPFPEKVVKPHSKPTSSPVIRKSIQDYPHDESVEGLKNKYINTSQGVDGYEDSLYLPNGEEVNGIWRLVDAFSISPSHDPFTFHSTKGFPRAGGGSSANTRDYANEPDAQLQVIQLAGDFDGRALGFDSAVVVTKDGVVISGNNRTMSSQLAARKRTDKKYVEALMKRCRSFGFTSEQVQAFEHPRVVFEIDSQDYSPEHFDKYNQSDKKEQSEEARIVKFSKIVKPNVLRDIADVASRFQWDLTQVFAISAACAELTTIFVKNNVFSQAELPKYFDGNKISSAGKQFLYEYILGGVLNESVIRALYAEGMGNLKQNVIGSVQLLLQNWACGSFSVIDELNSAIRYAIAFITDINNKKFVVPKIDKEEAKSMSAEDKVAFNLKAFDVWASQGDLLEDKHPLVLKLAGALVYSASLFKDYLTRLNAATASAARTERETSETGNAGLFEEDFTPDRNSLLEKAVASWQRRNAVKRSILSSVLRGVFAIHGKEKEATDAIQTGIAQYGYSPEFSYFRSQGGAVVASFNQSYSNFLNKASMYKKIHGGSMMNTMRKSQAVFSDLQNKIMKWTAQSSENKKAYQQAMKLFRENFGKNPRTEKDAKIIMKTAQQMAKTGQVYSDDSFKQAAQQAASEDGGQAQQPQGGQGQKTQGQGSSQRGKSSGGVSPQDPVALFKAIQALYKSGSISKEQVEKAFAMVTGGQGKQTVYDMPDQTQGSQQQEPLAASFNLIKSSGKNPGVVFDRLPKGVTGLQIGSRVIYNSMKLSSSLPVAVEDKEALYSGKEGVIKSINNELYNVEMPEDGEIISAYGTELTRVASEEEILSARGNISDPMREYVQQFLSNIPTLTQVPENYKDERIVKERLEPDHVCYWYSETIDNGKPYTVEFHVSPGEPFCDVYVVRDFDNTPLDDGGYHIEDFEDWNLSEVDYVEGLFVKEKASTGKEASFDKDKRGTAPYKVDDNDPYLADRVSARFNRWSAQVAAGLSLGRGMSLPDMAIVSGLARVLSGGIKLGVYVSYPPGYSSGDIKEAVEDRLLPKEKDADVYDLDPIDASIVGVKIEDEDGDEPIVSSGGKLSKQEWDKLYDDGVIGREEWYRGYDMFGDYELEDREQRPAKEKGGFFGMGGSVNSSLADGFNKTLTTVDKLTHNPLSVVDDVAALPFKFLDKVTGKGKVKSSVEDWSNCNPHHPGWEICDKCGNIKHDCTCDAFTGMSEMDALKLGVMEDYKNGASPSQLIHDLQLDFGVPVDVANEIVNEVIQQVRGVASSAKQPITSSNSDDEDYDPNEDPAYARALADKESQWADYAQARDWAIANWPTNKIRIKALFPNLAEYELVDIMKEVRQEMANKDSGL